MPSPWVGLARISGFHDPRISGDPRLKTTSLGKDGRSDVSHLPLPIFTSCFLLLLLLKFPACKTTEPSFRSWSASRESVWGSRKAYCTQLTGCVCLHPASNNKPLQCHLWHGLSKLRLLLTISKHSPGNKERNERSVFEGEEILLCSTLLMSFFTHVSLWCRLSACEGNQSYLHEAGKQTN